MSAIKSPSDLLIVESIISAIKDGGPQFRGITNSDGLSLLKSMRAVGMFENGRDHRYSTIEDLLFTQQDWVSRNDADGGYASSDTQDQADLLTTAAAFLLWDTYMNWFIGSGPSENPGIPF